MNLRNLVALAAIFSAGIAAAHTGVKNATVKARMDAMSGIGAQMKVMGQMSKEIAPFDAKAARKAAAEIARLAAVTPDLFEARESDPTSEAKTDIWANFEDFTEKSKQLETVALGLSESISEPGDLVPAMRSLGATCKSCHSDYRE